MKNLADFCKTMETIYIVQIYIPISKALQKVTMFTCT